MQTSKTTIALILTILFAIAASAHGMMFGRGPKKPPAREFGLGPRTSGQGRYLATLQPAQPLKVRKMQSIRVAITAPDGKGVDGATITVDGGMPQHGHGLPTKPRVTKSLGGGVYEIEGVRFNMGGWWELELTVAGPAGADTVTFNLAL